jgi:hypothetical protein
MITKNGVTKRLVIFNTSENAHKVYIKERQRITCIIN